MINFYRDVFKRRSHILSPLNDLAAATSKQKQGEKKKSKVPFKMLKVHLDAFKEAKEMIMAEAKLAFPDFSKPFHLYIDASDIQLGETLVQDGKPLGFYTRKLNKAQRNYTVGEKELLGIVEGLKAFAGVIRGQDLTVHTDHLNLLYNKLPSQRMTRWRLLLEKYHPKVVHIAGLENDAADALSRLDITDKANDARIWGEKSKKLEYANVHMMNICMFLSESEFEDDGFNDDCDDEEGLLAMTEMEESAYALDLKSMREAQLDDEDLVRIVRNLSLIHI